RLASIRGCPKNVLPVWLDFIACSGCGFPDCTVLLTVFNSDTLRHALSYPCSARARVLGRFRRSARGSPAGQRTFSSWAATASNVASEPGRPISWTPMDKPSSVLLTGTATAGRPHTLTSEVNGEYWHWRI